jgi:glutathione S-transferase
MERAVGNEQMLKIYDAKGFPNPARIRIALAEKGLQDRAEFIPVNVPAGEHRQPEFLRRNPSGAVPVLELADGTYIAECTAIIEYLDHLDGEPVLTGRTARERAIIHMEQRRAEAGLLDALTTYFHHATPGLGPKIETYQNREWGEKSRERAIAGMRYFDRVLAARPYLAGDSFSMADITALAGMKFAAFVGGDWADGCSYLDEWFDRVTKRPSVVDAW